MNHFSKLTGDALEEHLSNYLVPKWSISSVKKFMNNQKLFEKEEIFGEWVRGSSASAMAGTAYHHAVAKFFEEFKKGKTLSFDETLQHGHQRIEEFTASEFKTTKQLPTVEAIKLELYKKVNMLLTSFFKEVEAYLDDVEEVLDVEPTYMRFVTISGEDIPIPLKAKPDLVYVNKAGELAILDHKSKYAYTAEEEVDFEYSWQSLSYTLVVEEELAAGTFAAAEKRHPKIKEGVRRFCFYENKNSLNRDGKNQIRKIEIDIQESRPLYEAMLLEPVLAMVKAVSDPDFVYLMNPNDKLTDGGEMVDFWIKSRIEEPENFPNIREAAVAKLNQKKKEIAAKQLRNIPQHVIEEFKKNTRKFLSFSPMENATPAERIEHRLRALSTPLLVKVKEVIEGHSNDLFLLEVDAGVKISSIFKHHLDIAAALGEDKVRIRQSLVKREGSSYVGIEVSKINQHPIFTPAPDHTWKIPIGKDNFGNTIGWDLANASTPHLLGGGASGSGKSVAIRSMIHSLQANKGSEVEIIILDPKYEFVDMKAKGFEVYNDIEEIETFMGCLVEDMQQFFKTGQKSSKKRVIFFDEVNDALQQAKSGKELETHALQEVGTYANGNTKVERVKTGEDKSMKENILMIAQKARSAGIHLALFAQRLTAKAMDGDSKVNFPVRLCFAMPSEIDSRVILDQSGAEFLNGKGDGLLISPEYKEPQRIQSFMVKE